MGVELAGLATDKPLLALLGLFLGHQFDRGYRARFGDGADRLQAHTVLGKEFVRALFQTMGHLAKLDGRVSEDEIRAARSVMHRLGLGPSQVQQAISWFNEGKGPGFALAPTLRSLRHSGARRAESRRLFVRLLLEVSLAKTRFPASERTAVWAICGELGW